MKEDNALAECDYCTILHMYLQWQQLLRNKIPLSIKCAHADLGTAGAQQ